MKNLPKPKFWNTIKRGSRGPDVEAWQNVLITDGYPLDPYGADADFGGMTERKTKAWQAEHGLVDDGIVGRKTREAILSHGATVPSPPPTGGIDLCELFRKDGVVFTDASVEPRPNRVFSPVGIILHHTAAGGTTNAPSLGIIRTGRPGIYGPLAPILIARLGGIYVTCSQGGVCNHAGMGRGGVLDKVRRGEPLESADVSWGVPDSIGGNSWFYGVELENAGDGIEPFGEAQYSSALAVCRSIVAHHGWGSNAVIAHHEWSRRKIDPNRTTFSIKAFRESL